MKGKRKRRGREREMGEKKKEEKGGVERNVIRGEIEN